MNFFSFYSFFFLHQDRMKLLVFFIFSEKNSWNIFLIYFFFFLSCLQVCVFDIIFLHSCFFFIINVRRMDVRSTKWLLNLNSSKLLSFNYFQLIKYSLEWDGLSFDCQYFILLLLFFSTVWSNLYTLSGIPHFIDNRNYCYWSTIMLAIPA